MSLIPPTSPYPGAPPTTPGPIAMGQGRSAWPTAIGVISIVFGVLSGLSNAVQVISPLFMEAMQAGMPPEVRDQMRAQTAVTRQWFPVTISIAAGQLALGILLLACGVLILARRRSGPSLTIWWAVLKIVLVAVSAYVGRLVQADMTKAMQASGQFPGGWFGMTAGLFGAVGIMMVLVTGWAWPVFVLVWFSRPTIRREVSLWT